MKKVFALGVASLVMLGTASQASAYFEDGNFMLVAYDRVAEKEYGIDLGALNLSLENVTLRTGLTFINKSTGNPFGSGAQSGVGIFSDFSGLQGRALFEGYFGTTNASGTSNVNTAPTAGSNFKSYAGSIEGQYRLNDATDGTTDGISYVNAKPKTIGSYLGQMNGVADGYYGNIHQVANLEAEIPTGTDFVDIYLYHFMRLTTPTSGLYQVGDNYAAVIRLTGSGDVILNPSPVPVPGAAWLLGAGLLGLAGIRRKNNS